MKTNEIPYLLKGLLFLMIGVLPITGRAQSSTEKITREFSFEKKGDQNAFMIFNINGKIKVEGYAGDKIIVEVEKIITAKTDARLLTGKEEIDLGVLDRADSIILYVKGVCNSFGKNTGKNGWKKDKSSYGYNWNNCNGNWGDCDKGYDYRMNFMVKVPHALHLFVSTVNEGDIEMSDTKGSLVANNVNGNIRLKNISGTTHASTINGSVDVDYAGNPPGDSRYYSLNGNINALFKKGLTAQLAFKSFNGDFYSSLENIVPMAVRVEKFEKGEGIHYKVNGNRYRVGTGGPLLDFETFNGDVYLKEKSN
jgi:hypothetical protein